MVDRLIVATLTKAQRSALDVLSDDRVHEAWKWKSDPQAARGKGRVNYRAADGLRANSLAVFTYDTFGTAYARITQLGRELLDQESARG